MTDYDQLILELAKAKEHASELQAKYGPMLAELKAAENHAKNLEAAIRASAMRDFVETGERKFHAALDVKLVAVRSYDTKGNFEQALKRAPDSFVVDLEQLRIHAATVVPLLNELAPKVLKLDEKRVKEIAETPSGEWVEVSERREPRVYLASKLGDLLISQQYGASHAGQEEERERDQGRD
jgi:hypothetical protein